MNKLFLKLLLVTTFTVSSFITNGSNTPNVVEFSTAGFYQIDGSPRSVESMNPAWRFFKGDVEGAEAVNFDDSSWQVVSLPNGLEILPLEASGGKNYRGGAWYRKKFTLDRSKYDGKQITLYFEAIMGKSKVWLNGELVNEHFGGFTPIPIDLTNKINFDGENTISVWCDNSDDPIYPPGKPQSTLDFCYFGGIYRDCYLISTDKLFITDANSSNKVAGGGVIVHYTNVSKSSATVNLQIELANNNDKNMQGSVEIAFDNGVSKNIKYSIKKGEKSTLSTAIVIKNPELWSPESPKLYNAIFTVKDNKGVVVDSYRSKFGIRTFEFNAKDGFVLNGEVYPRKLIGANRHQDFALVGNALSNSLHWRDAEKLKGAGMEIIRNAHYPQDPSFMDACDALGLFLISNTPGWQFWNDEPIFEKRVYEDIRQIVRRDRNYASVIMWEPILNETWYPEEFAKNVNDIVKEEYPFAPNYTASDSHAKGSSYLDLKFSHPHTPNGLAANYDTIGDDEVYFTREFGDNVDDWSAHNSPSRVAIQWGETPQLIQAKGYGKPDHRLTCLDVLYRTDNNCVGGTLWHSFDHQRGYHPDPFYGGIMTEFRRPKYSYYMFQSQGYWKEPMVYIANLMTPFSPEDVTVYSNCDSVVLHTQTGEAIRTYNKPKRESYLDGSGMPSPIITFEKAYNVMKHKELTSSRRYNESFLLAEGYNDGKLVASHRVSAAIRPAKLNIVIDTMSVEPVANGGDLVVVVAQVVDTCGNVKRLNNEWIKFEVEGEATIVGDESINANPTPVLWGEAPILLRTTVNPGKVKIKASVLFSGDHTPLSGEAEFTTLPSDESMIYSPAEYKKERLGSNGSKISSNVQEHDREKLNEALKEVEEQQTAFGENR